MSRFCLIVVVVRRCCVFGCCSSNDGCSGVAVDVGVCYLCGCRLGGLRFLATFLVCISMLFLCVLPAPACGRFSSYCLQFWVLWLLWPGL